MIEGFPTKTELVRDSKLVSISSTIDTTKIYFIELKDGTDIFGYIIQKNSTSITLKTSSDPMLEILISEIKSISDNSENNAIYGNLGGASLVGVWASATIYYERILNHERVIKPFIKGGVGGYALWGEGGFFLLTHYGILAGQKSSHFEISAGVNWFLNGDLQGDYKYNALYLLSATIGYRYKKPGKRFIFRTGVSTPEGIYFGIGCSF